MLLSRRCSIISPLIVSLRSDTVVAWSVQILWTKYWIPVQRTFLSRHLKLSKLRWLGCVANGEHSSTAPCFIFHSSHWVKEAMRRSTNDVRAWSEKVYFGKVFASSLCDWDSKDPPTSWLKKLDDMVANKEQRRLRCHFLPTRNDWKKRSFIVTAHSLYWLLRFPPHFQGLHVHPSFWNM